MIIEQVIKQATAEYSLNEHKLKEYCIMESNGLTVVQKPQPFHPAGIQLNPVYKFANSKIQFNNFILIRVKICLFFASSSSIWGPPNLLSKVYTVSFRGC
jgi:hypothetical protein